ncbi:hypothetical protein ASG22_03560 [Chryseobacterium sp. Leaf405]|uniref:hypothetical protein n=1 Tax=Chryseobacterium sp. Leaf405 TaxID=1736367 RepID=UPI0006F462F0|nr:hypothetical protein [Chryseobacterium sp. Leaf405]KQT25794.1 hypothetical protein ASG22_03560 [Chryseobacterium sp. Leaf405]
MKDTLKLIGLAVVSMGAVARSCVKTGARVAEFSEPMLMETRYMKNAGTLEREGVTATDALKGLKTTKDAVDITDAVGKLNEINEKDTIKNVKQKKAKKRMKR